MLHNIGLAAFLVAVVIVTAYALWAINRRV